MPSYTRHKRMASPHYVCTYVSSDGLFNCLNTYTTGVWLLPTMYGLMSDQINLLTEHLIAYTTGV